MNTNLTDIESRLWNAAAELRANFELCASEYSTPVLGLIFLRYTDNKLTQTEQEIKREQTTSTRMSIDKTTYQAQAAAAHDARMALMLKHSFGSYADRGLDWDKITDEDRIDFVDNLIHEGDRLQKML